MRPDEPSFYVVAMTAFLLGLVVGSLGLALAERALERFWLAISEPFDLDDLPSDLRGDDR